MYQMHQMHQVGQMYQMYQMYQIFQEDLKVTIAAAAPLLLSLFPVVKN